MNKLTRTLIILVVFLTSEIHGARVNSMVCFGDSLSDSGNNGHYSDGALWIEILAGKLGLPIPQHSKLGGLNFAYAGAMSGHDEASDILNVGKQISSYLNCTQGQADPEALYFVWVGGNDFLAKRNPLDLIDNIADHIETLADAGATQFFVPNLPSLIHAPKGQAMIKEMVDQLMNYLPNGFEQAVLSAVKNGVHSSVYLYNILLERRLSMIRQSKNVVIHYLDVFSMFNSVLDNLESYGLSDKSDLFYDELHPNAKGHELIADAASRIIKSEL